MAGAQDILAQAGAAQHGQRLEVPGDRAFLLYDSYGFPLEITAEIAAGAGVSVDVAAFDAALQAQRQRSKDSAKARRRASALTPDFSPELHLECILVFREGEKSGLSDLVVWFRSQSTLTTGRASTSRCFTCEFPLGEGGVGG